MTRIPEYERGFRNGASRAVNLLHQIAATADDPVLRKAMHSAAREIGMELALWQCRAEVRKRARLDSDMICPRRPVVPHDACDD